MYIIIYMKNKLKNIVSIAVVVFIIACSHKTANTKTVPPEEKANFTKATVINLKLDGCSWMLQLDGEKKLQPENLTDEFKKENLKVWIQYQPVKQGNSICMAGEMVTITAIELRK